MTILTELHYLPSIPFFSEVAKSSGLIIEAQENYQKQTYRNRCYILINNGIKALTIPILKTENKSIKEIKIDYSQDWTKIHIRTISSAYGNSAYFEFYFEYFEKIIMSKRQYLFDLNIEILTKCLDILKMDTDVEQSLVFDKEPENSILDLRNRFSLEFIQPKEVDKPDKKYFQQFGNVFVENLSIIDLIFNQGTNAKQYLYNK